jgi:hypothetical protein
MATENQLPSEVPQVPAATPAPGTPEYDAAMAAKFDQAQGAQPVAATKPEGIPDKFWDAEKGEVRTADLLKSYQELEKMRMPAAPAAPAPAPEGTPPAAPEGGAPDAQQVLESKGLNFDQFSTEFATNGALGEESYQALEKAGIPKDVVDAYIEGQVALASARDNVGYEVAGGKESFNAMAAWAVQTLPVADREAFNKAVAGSEAEMRQAVTALRAQYEAANGRAPQLLGGQSAASGSQGYESRAQMVADMKDPRYQKDPAFRAKVMSKASVSAF